MMYSIRINEVNDKESQVKAYAGVTFGNSLAVRNIAVVQKKGSDELFVSMPSHKTNEVTDTGEPVFKDVCNPINKDSYTELTNSILSAYENRKTLSKEGLVINSDQENEKLNYSVRVTPFTRDDSSLVGIGRVYLDDAFVISNVKLINGKSGIFVSMPDYKTDRMRDDKPVYREIAFPVTKEFREELYSAIEKAYEEARAKETEKAASSVEKSKDKVVETIKSKDTKAQKADKSATQAKRASKKAEKSKDSGHKDGYEFPEGVVPTVSDVFMNGSR